MVNMTAEFRHAIIARQLVANIQPAFDKKLNIHTTDFEVCEPATEDIYILLGIGPYACAKSFYVTANDKFSAFNEVIRAQKNLHPVDVWQESSILRQTYRTDTPGILCEVRYVASSDNYVEYPSSYTMFSCSTIVDIQIYPQDTNYLRMLPTEGY